MEKQQATQAAGMQLFQYGFVMVWMNQGEDSQPTFLFVASSKRYSRYRVQFSRLLLFWGSNLPSQVCGRSDLALLYLQQDSPGETIPSLVNKFLFRVYKVTHYETRAFCTYIVVSRE